jgi:hypothetical protein
MSVICLVSEGVVRVRLCYLMRICVITYTCEVVVGPRAQLCTLLEVWVLGVGMSTLDAQTAVRRGSGAPSTDVPGVSPRHLQWQIRAGD